MVISMQHMQHGNFFSILDFYFHDFTASARIRPASLKGTGPTFVEVRMRDICVDLGKGNRSTATSARVL